jgi:hypothetical protein
MGKIAENCDHNIDPRHIHIYGLHRWCHKNCLSSETSFPLFLNLNKRSRKKMNHREFSRVFFAAKRFRKRLKRAFKLSKFSNFQSFQTFKVFKLSKFSNFENFQTFKVFKLSKEFSNFQKNFQTFKRIFKLSKFSNFLSFQTSKLSKEFSKCLGNKNRAEAYVSAFYIDECEHANSELINAIKFFQRWCCDSKS